MPLGKNALDHAQLHLRMLSSGPGLEYEALAQGVKAVLQAEGPAALSASALAAATPAAVRRFFGANEAVPLEAERARLLREARFPLPCAMMPRFMAA